MRPRSRKTAASVVAHRRSLHIESQKTDSGAQHDRYHGRRRCDVGEPQHLFDRCRHVRVAVTDPLAWMLHCRQQALANSFTFAGIGVQRERGDACVRVRQGCEQLADVASVEPSSTRITSMPSCDVSDRMSSGRRRPASCRRAPPAGAARIIGHRFEQTAQSGQPRKCHADPRGESCRPSAASTPSAARRTRVMAGPPDHCPIPLGPSWVGSDRSARARSSSTCTGSTARAARRRHNPAG